MRIASVVSLLPTCYNMFRMLLIIALFIAIHSAMTLLVSVIGKSQAKTWMELEMECNEEVDNQKLIIYYKIFVTKILNVVRMILIQLIFFIINRI